MTTPTQYRDRYYRRLSDPGTHPGTPVVKAVVAAFAEEHVDEELPLYERISAVFETFETKVSAPTVSEALDCSESYVRRFDYDDDRGEAYEKAWSVQNQDAKVSPGQRTRILRRDGDCCLRCGNEMALEVHHVVPINDGGSKNDANLATLCEHCHTAAHGGSKTSGQTVYDDRAGFDEWLKSELRVVDAVRGQTKLNDFSEPE